MARAICEGAPMPSKPWLWPAWWVNVLRLGKGMGREFGRGLMRSAKVPADIRIGGALREGPNQPTAVLAVELLVLEIVSIEGESADLGRDANEQIAAAALASESLEVCFGVPVKTLREGEPTSLNLSNKGLGQIGGTVLAELVTSSAKLASLE